MPQGSFNVSRLLRRAGLKNVVEMPVLETIQPVMPLGTMYGQVPVHVPPMSMIGGLPGPTVGEESVIDIHSLDPGGLIVQSFREFTANVITVTIRAAPFVFITQGPILLVHQVMSNEGAPLSTVNIGTGTGLTGQLPNFLEIGPGQGFAPIFIPRGQHMILSMETANLLLRHSMVLIGLPATEGGE